MSDAAAEMNLHAAAPGALRRSVTIALIGFLTLVDLFATQAILPSLAALYGVAPAEIGVAANASTIGMAIAGLAAGALGRKLERRSGIWLSLALLAVPTCLLAYAPNLTTFALLRVVQGLFMATAFTLTLTYLAERCSKADAAGALAAYVTGGVASNLVGRLVAATVTGAAGTDANFFLFAALNLAGAAIAWFALTHTPAMAAADGTQRPITSAWRAHLADPPLRRAFAIGFLILFGFIGTFTYVGFVLMRPPLALSMTALGLVFLVFAPSMATTPMAGAAANRFGAARVLPAALAVALAGLLLLLIPRLEAFLLGLVLVGVGTFFAQAVATGFVGRVAQSDRAAASGLYLSFYYGGGLAGAAAVGQLFDRFGWNAAVIGIFAALALAAWLGAHLREGENA
jgi:MFS transporter, YNFM family, putative membrane transport protein